MKHPLALLRGKVVLIDFWGTWCGPCLALMPDLQRLHEVYGKDGFAIVGIHTKRDVDSLDDYLRKNPKPWPNLPDTKGDLAAAFAVPHYPGLYLLTVGANCAWPCRFGRGWRRRSGSC